MAYFPHAFQKMLSATHPAGGATPVPFPSGGSTPASTVAIAAGQVAIVNALTNVPVDPAVAPAFGTAAGQYTQVYLAQGSFHTNDKIGPFHGGYKETVKSKGINAKFVSSFYRTDPAAPVNEVLEVCQVNCGLECDTMYDLRLDIKGSPALRFLTHNLYQTLSAYTGCCTFSGANTTPDKVDPTVVLLQWADQINSVSSGNNSTPFLNQFVQGIVWVKTALSTTATGTLGASQVTVVSAGTGATAIQAGNKVKVGGFTAYVASTYTTGTTIPLVNANGSPFVLPAAIAAGTAIKFYRTTTTATYVPATGAGALLVDSCLDIVGAYVDTVFGDCSFSPKDHFETEPILIYASIASYSNNSNDINPGNGDPCVVSCFTVAEIQEARQGKGFGETLVRELILAKRYQQEPWYDDPRLREVMNDTTLGTSNSGGPEIVRGNRYSVYYLLHSIPRKNNPTGVFDNDQYLVKIVVPSYTTAAGATLTSLNAFQTWWNTWLASAQAGVALQVVA
jgi:hypothetical protein